MFHLILRRRRITRSNISNTRRSVSFNINTRRGVSSGIQILTSNTSNTRGSFSSDIQTLISNISNTRRRVSFDIQTPRNNRRRISHYRYVILYIKREKKWLYLSDIHTLGSNITNTKREVFRISKYWELIHQTRGVFYVRSRHAPRSLSNTRRRISFDRAIFIWPWKMVSVSVRYLF